jgi:nicotinate phosphoribosyltransferase
MAYAHWKNGRHEEEAIFELFFRKNPFGGEYTIFCGLDECLKHVTHFHFTPDDIAFLQSTPALQHCDPAFFQYLLQLDSSKVQLYALPEGTVAFPRIPLLVLQGPIIMGQLLETTLLTLVNYPSLVATNAARMVIAAHAKPLQQASSASSKPASPYPSHQSLTQLQQQQQLQQQLSSSSHHSQHHSQQQQHLVSLPRQCYKTPLCVEFGLRRAQGPDGGFSASKYSFVGGFDATSNVQAGKLLGLPISGTHAHSFVQAYSSLDEVTNLSVVNLQQEEQHDHQVVVLLPRVLQYRTMLGGVFSTTNDGELAAFIAYAAAFPDSFLCLIDTYDTLSSGLPNFILVSLVLDDLGHKPLGIRLDSGDLAYLSMECATMFANVMEQHQMPQRDYFHELNIVASNDINEAVLHSLNKEGHAITIFGIGTNLVTCQDQPALGCVYKLVQVGGKPRMKLSQDIDKVLIPGRKHPYRLYGQAGYPLLDVMVGEHEAPPQAGRRIMCRHPFVERKRAAVTATRVVPLHVKVFDHGKPLLMDPPKLVDTKEYVRQQLACMRPDILRYVNPTPYKVSVSHDLFSFLHELWQTETPVAELT